jgi:hypothetical protein
MCTPSLEQLGRILVLFDQRKNPNQMKIEIDTDDIEIFEGYEDYSEQYKNAQDGQRRWGRISWLYKGDILTQIGGKSAETIEQAIKKAT